MVDENAEEVGAATSEGVGEDATAVASIEEVVIPETTLANESIMLEEDVEVDDVASSTVVNKS